MLAAALKAPPYEFTQDWFTGHGADWRDLTARLQPRRILEIGCYEGRATTFFIETLAPRGGHLTCIDTWEGAADLPAEMMAGVEARFDHNVLTAIAATGFGFSGGSLCKLKQRSVTALARLMTEGFTPYDLIYVDASHTAPDVLTDAVMAFELLRVGGAMVFDDYAWQLEPQGQQDALNMPKPAIDAFVNLNLRRLTFTAFGDAGWQALILRTA